MLRGGGKHLHGWVLLLACELLLWLMTLWPSTHHCTVSESGRESRGNKGHQIRARLAVKQTLTGLMTGKLWLPLVKMKTVTHLLSGLNDQILLYLWLEKWIKMMRFLVSAWGEACSASHKLCLISELVQTRLKGWLLSFDSLHVNPPPTKRWFVERCVKISDKTKICVIQL